MCSSLSQNIESAKTVSISCYIDKNRGAYDNAFISSENQYNDCTPFIEYMLQTYQKAYYSVSNL